MNAHVEKLKTSLWPPSLASKNLNTQKLVSYIAYLSPSAFTLVKYNDDDNNDIKCSFLDKEKLLLKEFSDVERTGK